MQQLNPPENLVNKSFTDSFSDNCCAGKTIGTKTPSGAVRKGIDVEKLIGIDNGALRLQPLLKPAWGRQGIAYGPYIRTNGLAFAVFLSNGHNTSQTERIEPLTERLHRWMIGPETDKPAKRLLRWTSSQGKSRMLRKLLWWIRSTSRISRYFKPFKLPNIDENLAVGWFPREVPVDATAEGSAFIVHATGAENGELWTRLGGYLLSAFRGLQNLQVYYIVVLREKGAAYYAASVPNAHGLAAYPNMRPIAIDPFNDDATVYAGVYQSILGQNGFEVDTRIYGANVAQISDIATWYGTAQAADDLIGDGLLDGAEADKGGFWSVSQGSYELTADGARATQPDSVAMLECPTPSGLIHLLVETSTQITGVRILWRVQDKNQYWSFLADGDKCQLMIQDHDSWECLAVSDLWYLQPLAINSLQILDDGKTFSLYLNGKLVFNKCFTDTRLENATGVGIGGINPNNSLYFRSFEAHPRTIPIPSELDLGSPWVVEGTEMAITEDFAGAAGDLMGKTTTSGSKVWHRNIGLGVIELTGNSTAKVQADAKHPNPGRTAYTIDWDHPEIADLQVDITPPGTRRGQGEKGRGGFIFWQDADNYITINNWLDDCYGGASMSSFFYLNGFEELFDAVWTNVGKRISWGVSHRLRMIFDGMNYMIFINDEPVLYRALTDVYPDAARLRINRVGIVANWEWGNDTGSVFQNFVAKV
ncbi:nucleotide-binding protein [Moorena sp. SIO4G3]|uniref:nucleotide-binding protein n=1 Tax=Moorena sp. SIO4G3 TaxID=2607821 RepID=UPI00142CB11B|nr:nucleotide-binding protein [Moorena sp. SIO4G3]NEO81363.1 nucleotide-binding protein [Moorena sp. SIO4G3]